jgi:hypothetical protein
MKRYSVLIFYPVFFYPMVDWYKCAVGDASDAVLPNPANYNQGISRDQEDNILKGARPPPFI